MKFIFFIANFLLIAVCNAQDVRNVAGKLTTLQKSLNENMDHIPAPQLQQLKADVQKFYSIALEAPLVKNPVGSNVQLVYDYHKPPLLHIPWQKPLEGKVSFDFFELYKDGKTGKINQDEESSGSLSISVNDLYYTTGEVSDNNMADAGYPVPVFFGFPEQETLPDSTTDYIETNRFQTLSYRIISNGKPLFIPLTKEQYLIYEIALEKYLLNDAQKKLDDAELGVTDGKKSLEDIYHKGGYTKAEFDGLVKTLQQQTDDFKNLVVKCKQNLDKYQKQLTSLSPSQKKEAAFVAMNKDGDRMELSDDDPARKGLYTPNPNYFNPSLPTTAIQLIIVRRSYNFTMSTPFMKKKIDDAYQQVDCAKLKALIQK